MLNLKPLRSPVLALLAVIYCGLFTGCRDDSPAARIAAANGNNVQRLANLYGSYQSQHGWKGPKDQDSLIKFIESLHDAKLERMGIDPTNIPALFVSERDSKEMKLRYSVQGGMGVSCPVVFEAEGLDGIRRVGFTAMRSEDADAARYDELWSGKADAAGMQRDEGGGR